MKRGYTLLILIALLLVVAACGGGGEEATPTAMPEPVAATQAPAQQQAAPAAATATPVPPTATPAPAAATATPEDEPLAEELTALEDLNSYRLVVSYVTQGVDSEGNPIDNSAEIISEYTKDPQARRMTVNYTDNANPDDQLGTMETYQIGQDVYMFIGDDMGWMRISLEESLFEDTELAMLSSGGIFSDLGNLDRVRPDQRINGIDSRRYRFNERTLSEFFSEQMGAVSGEGEVWIAKDGGYVTKYVLSLQVRDDSPGEFEGNMVEGVVEVTFELKDVNSDITIELPAEAAAGIALAGFEDDSFPIPDGSRIQAATANFTIIESETPAEEVVAFYEEALAALGWTKDAQGSMSFGSMTSLAFTKGNAKLTLLVTADEDTGKTQVMVNTE